MAIRTFKDPATSDIAHETESKRARRRLPEVLWDLAYRKLVFLDNAHSLNDFLAWKSLRLEKLLGSRKGQYSIRINDQYRICFWWDGKDADRVEITDYH